MTRRWWAAYLAFSYAAGFALNVVLDRFGLVRGWWLFLPDVGLWAVIALVMMTPGRRQEGVSGEHDRV